jgi:hypothetical protein
MQVLTTAWVEGEKLSESQAADVGPLVTTMLNCYLIQLLESGFLHAGKVPFLRPWVSLRRILLLSFIVLNLASWVEAAGALAWLQRKRVEAVGFGL